MSGMEKNSASSLSPSDWRHPRTDPLAVLADPDDPRVVGWRSAARSWDVPDPVVVSYADAMRDPSWLERLPSNAVLRVDSPGRSLPVAQQMLDRGYSAARAAGGMATSPTEVATALSRRGALVNSRQWALGFFDVLAAMGNGLDRRPDIHMLADLDDIACMFDKSATSALLRSSGLPVPEEIGRPCSYEDLRGQMVQAGMTRAFVKLRYGAGGSGVIALERSHKAVQAWTTAEVDRTGGDLQLFNTRRIRKLQSESAIAEHVDALCRHEVHAERWVPKSGIGNHRFDIRALVVAGQPVHKMVRMSRTPITNLHLLNRRCSMESIRDKLPAQTFDDVEQTCRRVAGLFPRTMMVALDIAIGPRGRRHWVLEVNAFGDLIHDCTWEGRDPYGHQLGVIYGGMR